MHQPETPGASPRQPHPTVLAAIRAMQQEGDRSTAPAKLRLALAINYNVYSVGHWEAGRRQPCPDALERMDALLGRSGLIERGRIPHPAADRGA